MSNLLAKIKHKLAYEWYRRVRAKKDFKKGYAAFLKTGITPLSGYTALVNLYRTTNGTFNEIEQRKIAIENPPAPVTGPLKGILGTFDSAKFERTNATLNAEGYVQFDVKLPAHLVSRLYDYALHTKALVPPAYDSKVLYDPPDPVAEIYRFDTADLMQNEDIQSLVMDPVLVHIARNYLGSEPIFDFPAMWWSTTFLKEASAEAAQLYHFDLDRIKWLKFFIYLTDVTPLNGPHYYIRGTHLPGAKPKELLKRGYARIPDADVQKFYKKEDFVEICGEAGALFAGDTKCWHKGSALKRGHRLVLELQYTSSLFGVNIPRLQADMLHTGRGQG